MTVSYCGSRKIRQTRIEQRKSRQLVMMYIYKLVYKFVIPTGGGSDIKRAQIIVVSFKYKLNYGFLVSLGVHNGTPEAK